MLTQELDVTITALFILGGLIIGSLLNVVVYRIPLMLANPDNKKNLNLFFPRSKCRNCHKSIKFQHNIPIISYLLLKGKCSFCKNSISIQYPIIESITSLLTLHCWLYFGLSIELFGALLFLWLLIAISFIDINHKIIPDSLSFSLLMIGLFFSIIKNYYNLTSNFSDLNSSILGIVFGYLILWCVYQIHKIYTKKEGLGYGDFKLLAGLGAWLGWQFIPITIFIASIIGLIFGLGGIYRRKFNKETPIPFGPFLAIAGWFSFFYGPAIALIYPIY